MSELPGKFYFLKFILFVTIIAACREKTIKGTTIVKDPDVMNDVVAEQLPELLKKELDSGSRVLKIHEPATLQYHYQNSTFKPIFTAKQQVTPLGQQVLQAISNSRGYGLIPKVYHEEAIKKLQDKIAKDSTGKSDAKNWAQLELYLADGYMRMAKHIKRGRLFKDSSLNKADTATYKNLYEAAFVATKKADFNINTYFETIEPKYFEYDSLKIALQGFLKNNDLSKTYTYVPFPYTDSISFVKKLMKRLEEEGTINEVPAKIDSMELADAVIAYKKKRGMGTNPVPDKGMMSQLNSSPSQKFLKIALNMDRYKRLPERPETFVLVNLPAYKMVCWDGDTIAVNSRVIVGKKETRTPLITSEIDNFITNPFWSVPSSIIKKEMIPGLQRNSSYLSRRRMKLIDSRGRFVNPASINWSRYKNGIPFTVRQDYGSGNSLGVMKFNFDNDDAIYLHDTNQRYLFSSSYRALSHGCVRVQEFENLAKFIARKQKVFIKNYETSKRDSITPKGDTIVLKKTYVSDSALVVADSIPGMIRKKMHREIYLTNKIPIFINYFTATGHNGEVLLHEDIYGEDRKDLEQFGANFVG
jgi:L,D-transpeptidase YcbB